MSLTPLPTPPSTSDPANFATRADAFVAALATMVTEINAGAVSLAPGTVAGALTVTGDLTASGLFDISGASAGQIKFPASQNASVNANTLDDYEENTWTPTIAGSTTPGTQTYDVRRARYTKIGRLVFIECEVSLSAFDGASAGNLRLTGLPFPCNSANNGPNAIGWAGLNLSANYTSVFGLVIGGQAYMDIYEQGDNVPVQNLTVSAAAATLALYFCGFYSV